MAVIDYSGQGQGGGVASAITENGELPDVPEQTIEVQEGVTEIILPPCDGGGKTIWVICKEPGLELKGNGCEFDNGVEISDDETLIIDEAYRWCQIERAEDCDPCMWVVVN